MTVLFSDNLINGSAQQMDGRTGWSSYNLGGGSNGDNYANTGGMNAVTSSGQYVHSIPDSLSAIGDQYAQATYHGSAIENYGSVALIVRAAKTDTRDYYGFNSNNAEGSFLFKMVGGTRTSLGSISHPANNAVVRLEAVGTTITLKYNGTTVLSVTDSSLATGCAGVVGIFNSTGTLTDFEAGDFAAAAPTITNADDEAFANGETGIVITGTGFGASQGAGKVYLSPTNNVADGARVEQTVTAWSDTSITITCVKGGLSTDTNLYLFVVNNAAASNASGYVVQVQAQPTITQTLVGETGATVNSETGMTAIIFASPPTTATAPHAVVTGVSTNGSGVMTLPFPRGALTLNQDVWLVLMKDGTPAKGTCRKVTPTYA